MTTPHEEGEGRRDAQAPVAGARLEGTDITDILQAVPEHQRAKLARKFLDQLPGGQAASRARRRDNFRMWLLLILVAAIVLESLVAAYFAWWAPAGEPRQQDLDDVKDWFTIAVVPLTTAAALGFAFWYPSKEAD